MQQKPNKLSYPDVDRNKPIRKEVNDWYVTEANPNQRFSELTNEITSRVPRRKPTLFVYIIEDPRFYQDY